MREDKHAGLSKSQRTVMDGSCVTTIKRSHCSHSVFWIHGLLHTLSKGSLVKNTSELRSFETAE